MTNARAAAASGIPSSASSSPDYGVSNGSNSSSAAPSNSGTSGANHAVAGSGGGHRYEVAHYQSPPGIDVVIADELPDPLTASPPPALSKTAITVLRDVKAFLRLPTHANGASVRVPGLLSASTYSLTFTPSPPAGASPGTIHPALRHLPRSYFTVPVAAIRRVERSNPSGTGNASGSGVGTSTAASQLGLFLLDLHCKDSRMLMLAFGDEATADQMAGHIKRLAFVAEIKFLHAFSEPPPKVAPAQQQQQQQQQQQGDDGSGTDPFGLTSAGTYPSPAPVTSPTLAPFPGWDAYVPYRELARIGVLTARHPKSGEALWRVADVNREYEYAPTYPAVLVVPARASDAMLAAVAPFRSKARIPSLTWQHPITRSTLWRCSQPKVGMGNATNASDEALLGMIRDANVFSRDPSQPLLIVDCRPHANALANKAGGWGYESYMGCNLIFCGMNNIHALRDSYR